MNNCIWHANGDFNCAKTKSDVVEGFILKSGQPTGAAGVKYVDTKRKSKFEGFNDDTEYDYENFILKSGRPTGVAGVKYVDTKRIR